MTHDAIWGGYTPIYTHSDTINFLYMYVSDLVMFIFYFIGLQAVAIIGLTNMTQHDSVRL